MKNKTVLTALRTHYDIDAALTPLVGDVDLNFLASGPRGRFTVKVSQTNQDWGFEEALVRSLDDLDTIQCPKPVLNRSGEWITHIEDQGKTSHIRVLNWVPGTLWSGHKPITPTVLFSLGENMAQLNRHLSDFSHEQESRSFDWDLAQALWIKPKLHLHSPLKQASLNIFIQAFEQNQNAYRQLRKQVIHNDLNDNNILIQGGLVTGFIDFGDAIKTQLINEVAIACAYAIMGLPGPLAGAAEVVRGYHQNNPLQAEELIHLHSLIGMRLAVSVTKAALAKAENPENEYKQVSAQTAWELLSLWSAVDPTLALCYFRSACGFLPHPQQASLTQHLNKHAIPLASMFSGISQTEGVECLDLSVGSSLVGNANDYFDHQQFAEKLKRTQQKHPQALLSGGYFEPRSFYASEAFLHEGNLGPEQRSFHLGIDVWLPAETRIHAPLSGRIKAIHNNDNPRDYGPTLILEHRFVGGVFYTLYGHLSSHTLTHLQVGDEVAAGDLLAWVGQPEENGGWAPHLHFQIMLDMLGYTHDFPGACSPSQHAVMQSVCVDPTHLFNDLPPGALKDHANHELIVFRQQHLGKSLSLSYQEPLQILRGDDVYLLDQFGQKYLDTCNNVAHVGHEHPAVVKAGQAQMAVLNTNSRYLHPALIEFSNSLLATLPEELSVLHFVNSGSEANELALRMAKAFSGGEDIIALESGYHGNSNACIDISSYKFDGKGGQGAPHKTHIVPLPDIFRGLYRGDDASQKYVQHIKSCLDDLTANNKQVAAFIAETIVSCGGQIELPKGYLSQAAQWVRANGGAYIADEVQVGCGRIGHHFWAFQDHDVVPDILTIGKPIGNGHPLAVVACTQTVADRFANGMEYFNTFGGNPVSASIGNAVLGVIESERLQLNALHTGQYLKSQLQQLMQQHPIIKDVRGQGLFLGFELCDNQLNPLPKEADYLANRMRDLGVLISTDGPDYNVIKIKPPISFKRSHAEELMRRLSQVFEENAMNQWSQ